MSTSLWSQSALKARLRADIAFDSAPKPVTAAIASRRLEYYQVVQGVDAGTITADSAALLFNELTASVTDS